jgi:hypothetical protein
MKSAIGERIGLALSLVPTLPDLAEASRKFVIFTDKHK